jgi:hypothetical protein
MTLVDFKEIENVTNVLVSPNEIVVCGIPDEDDESHNCDEMGCSSVSHVIARHKLPAVRTEVEWFSQQMEINLYENDHKGGWENCGIFWLRERLVQEVRELSPAMYVGHNSESGIDSVNIIREAADVANFAMMIADKDKERLA